MPQAVCRRVALLAVHHIHDNGRTLIGGAEKYIQTVIRALLDAGANVHVGYSGDSVYQDLLEHFDPRRLTVEHTGWINPALSGDRRLRLETIRRRRRWLRATGADTIFAVQQAGGAAFAASLAAARSMHLRVVASLRQQPPALPPPTGKHWLGLLPSPEIWRRRLIWRLRIPANFCDALIYNSHTVARAFHQHYGFPRNRRHVIYNGEIPQDCPRHEMIARPTHIAAIGRVSRAKGADILLDAFILLARRHPSCRLTYYGDGPLIGDLAERARTHGLTDRVIFAGFQSNRASIYQSMDICVQASRRESMSNSVIESMARGIPCVVSDIGGQSESVENGRSGYVVPVGDPSATAAALGKLLDRPQLYSQSSEAALQMAWQKFDLRPLMRRTVETILGIEPRSSRWGPASEPASASERAPHLPR